MKDYLKSKVIQEISYWSSTQIEERSNAQGILFVVVNEVGQIITTRKTNGSACRTLEKRYLLKDHPAATEKLYVIMVDTKDLLQKR